MHVYTHTHTTTTQMMCSYIDESRMSLSELKAYGLRLLGVGAQSSDSSSERAKP